MHDDWILISISMVKFSFFSNFATESWFFIWTKVSTRIGIKVHLGRNPTMIKLPCQNKTKNKFEKNWSIKMWWLKFYFWIFYNNNSIAHMDWGVQMSCMPSLANIITNIIIMNFIHHQLVVNLWFIYNWVVVDL
jgi:hypothetical protein